MSRTENYLNHPEIPFITRDELIDIALTKDAKVHHFFLELGIPTAWVDHYNMKDGINGRVWKKSSFWDNCVRLAAEGEKVSSNDDEPLMRGRTTFVDVLPDLRYS
jgi:hypothetical protein